MGAWKPVAAELILLVVYPMTVQSLPKSNTESEKHLVLCCQIAADRFIEL